MLSCSQSSSPTDTIPVHTGHNTITELLITKLNDTNEWYLEINNTTLKVANPPPSWLIGFMETEMNKIIPKGRSFSIADELREETLLNLKNNNIGFKLVIFDNAEWIVWEKQDTEAVQDIITTVSTKAADAKFSE